MKQKDEMFRNLRLLGMLAVDMSSPSATQEKREEALVEYSLLQTELEKDINGLGEAQVNITGFDISHGKFLVISEEGTAQFHSGLMATAECIRNPKSSLVVEAIDTMIKEDEDE